MFFHQAWLLKEECPPFPEPFVPASPLPWMSMAEPAQETLPPEIPAQETSPQATPGLEVQSQAACLE